MKINSINNSNLKCTPIKPYSFKHTAVPYPEFQYAYVQHNNHGIFSAFAEKLSDIFNPEVSKQAKNIKNQINTIFEKDQTPAKVLYALA